MIRPILDRVLLRRLEEKQEGPIIKPDAYYESLRFEVLELGDFVIFAGQRFSQSDFLKVGDIVLIHQYDVEELPIDGQKLYLTRIQNVKGREKAQVAKSRAA